MDEEAKAKVRAVLDSFKLFLDTPLADPDYEKVRDGLIEAIVDIDDAD